VVQASWKMQEANPECKGRSHWHSRLVWHDHFTQKLRDFPDAQYENINPVYDSIRQDLDAEMFARWTEGQTGFPMVDACMRALKQTGFLNFRMRAMVASFLTYLLWQPWQPGAEWFQRCLIDFDTGINHQQWQMQAGTVGWHANRFYDPVLQAEKFDPEGLFIDKYVPELRAIPMPQKSAPWRMSASDLAKSGVVLGVDYPLVMIDRNAAVRRASFRRFPGMRGRISRLRMALSGQVVRKVIPHPRGYRRKRKRALSSCRWRCRGKEYDLHHFCNLSVFSTLSEVSEGLSL
jgi:deoxyribodipyrimidine photo-lyase